MRLWDAETGTVISELKRPGANITHVSFSPDGKYLFANGFTIRDGKTDLSSQFWDSVTGAEITYLQPGVVTLPIYSPDSKSVLVRSWSQLKTAGIWDLGTGKQLMAMTSPGPFTPRGFTPDGRQILGICDDQTVRFFDAETGEETKILKGHSRPITTTWMSADGQQLLTGSDDQTAKLWDLGAGGPTRVLAGKQRPADLASFSPDGRYAMTSFYDYTTRVWDVATGRPISIIRHSEFVRWAIFSPDSRQVLTISQVAKPTGTFDQKYLFRASEIVTGKELFGFTNASLWRISPDGKWVGGRSQEIPLLVLDQKKLERSNRAAVATLFISDAATGRQAVALKHTDEIVIANFSSDSKRIATGGDDNTVRVWDVATGQELYSLLHTTRITDVAFSPDGQRIVSATLPVEVKTSEYSKPEKTAVRGAVPTLHLWDVTTRREIAILGLGSLVYGLSFQFSTDSRQILTGLGENNVRTFNARTGLPLHVFKGHSGIINSAIFFQDGKRLLTGSEDHTAKLWDTETGRELLTLPHSAAIKSIAISPDNQRILTATVDGTTTIWSAADGKEMKNVEAK